MGRKTLALLFVLVLPLVAYASNSDLEVLNRAFHSAGKSKRSLSASSQDLSREQIHYQLPERISEDWYVVAKPYLEAIKSCDSSTSVCVGRWSYKSVCPGTPLAVYVPAGTTIVKLTLKNNHKYAESECRQVGLIASLDREFVPPSIGPDLERQLRRYAKKWEVVFLEDLTKAEPVYVKGGNKVYVFLRAVEDRGSEENVQRFPFSSFMNSNPAVWFPAVPHVLYVYTLMYADELDVEVFTPSRALSDPVLQDYVYGANTLEEAANDLWNDLCSSEEVCGSIVEESENSSAKEQMESAWPEFEIKGDEDSISRCNEAGGMWADGVCVFPFPEKPVTYTPETNDWEFSYQKVPAIRLSNGNLMLTVPAYTTPVDLYLAAKVNDELYVYTSNGKAVEVSRASKILPVMTELFKGMRIKVPLDALPDKWFFEKANHLYVVVVPAGKSPLDPGTPYVAVDKTVN